MNKTINISYEEGEGLEREELKGKVIFKRLNFSEMNTLHEEGTDIKIFGNTQQINAHPAKLKELAILKSVVSCDLKKITYFEDKVTKAHVPTENGYALDIGGIQALPVEVGNQLFDAFTDLNTLSEKKNIN
jgi:hypothetical protein